MVTTMMGIVVGTSAWRPCAADAAAAANAPPTRPSAGEATGKAGGAYASLRTDAPDDDLRPHRSAVDVDAPERVGGSLGCLCRVGGC
jgi:hypothetical protein